MKADAMTEAAVKAVSDKLAGRLRQAGSGALAGDPRARSGCRDVWHRSRREAYRAGGHPSPD